MRISKIFNQVQPYFAAIAAIFVVTLLVSAIYFTEVDKQWTVFLSGILIASILGLTSRASRAEWISTRRTAQLTLLKDKLEQEVNLRKKTSEDHQQLLSVLKQTEGAFGRLIPHKLLELMGRNSILDVQLGDQFERKLTVMCTDIRDFTMLSENMTPQANFDFLNAYLAQMEPVIGEHGGIIDKYIGDSILALFTRGADDALSGAIHMLEKLEKYNAGRARAGYTPLQIGVGLNTGLVMIGTVGGPTRMETTVIGDAVNLTSRIEGATKTYYTPLLISQNTLYDLAVPGKYDIRFLDRIRVKGKTQPLSIYEVFDNDPIKLRDGKRADKVKFETAIAYYHMKDIKTAMRLLTECIAKTPKDIPAHIYLSRCEQYQTTGMHFTTGELNTQLEWRKEYQIQVVAIDRSHRHLFNKVNEFISASIAGNIAGIRLVFSYLASHLIESKEEEEELMKRYSYPFIEEHIREHKRFIEDFMALKEELDSENHDPSFLAFRAQLLLFDWFSGHIAHSDRHAGRFIVSESPHDAMGATTMRLRSFLVSDAHRHQSMKLPMDPSALDD
ncbi:MAG: adenylate/guanylate cyclase domain-containing protein [Gallionella sp.]|nr:adenylate/guanylate cyclase domain-containing protein [Gallionella sp.]